MKPTLLLLTGMLNDVALWDAVAPPLRTLADVRTLAPTQASVSEMAQVAWDCLADVPTESPIVACGFSLGGFVVQEMLAYPQRPLHAAVLMSTSAQPDTEKGAIQREKNVQLMRTDFAAAVARIASFAMHNPTEAMLTSATDMMQRVGAQTAIRQMHAIATRNIHRAALSALTLPVLVLCGSHDNMTAPALSQDLAALIPTARCQIIEGVGHMLPIQAPQAVVQALQSLLASLA